LECYKPEFLEEKQLILQNFQKSVKPLFKGLKGLSNGILPSKIGCFLVELCPKLSNGISPSKIGCFLVELCPKKWAR